MQLQNSKSTWKVTLFCILYVLLLLSIQNIAGFDKMLPKYVEKLENIAGFDKMLTKYVEKLENVAGFDKMLPKCVDKLENIVLSKT